MGGGSQTAAPANLIIAQNWHGGAAAPSMPGVIHEFEDVANLGSCDPLSSSESTINAREESEGVSDLLMWYPLLEDESNQLWMGIP
jgi:hypothetical protein